MKVIVVGAGKVGFYLTKTLLEHGHTPTVIERERARCLRVANQLDIPVICDDGSSPRALELAGAGTAHSLVSVTGADEDNLIVCQLAKRQFAVRRTIARVNNPKNTEIMKQLGVDIPVSGTDALAFLLEREIETAAMSQLIGLNSGKSALLELCLPEQYVLAGHPISEILLPEASILVSITRNGEMLIPKGRTTLQSGDRLLAVCSNHAVHALTDALKLNL